MSPRGRAGWTCVDVSARGGTAGASREGIDTEEKAHLAVRTVVVTTKAAFRSHRATGREDLARASARRGLELLAGLADGSPAIASDGMKQVLESARDELRSLAEPS